MSFVKKIWKDHNVIVRSEDNTVEDGKPTDMVIVISGRTGVGNSRFINTIFNKDVMGIGDSKGDSEPKHYNANVNHFICPHPLDSTRRLVFVNLPSFGDTHADDVEILRRISVWLVTSYSSGMKLAGAIYLTDITQYGMSETMLTNLYMFRSICGNDIFPSIVLGVSNGPKLDISTLSRYRSCLENIYWKDMIKDGSTVIEVNDTRESAMKMILHLLRQYRIDKNVFLLQKELANMRKIIPDTSAGKQLRYTLERQLKLQKKRKASQEQIEKTSSAIQTLSVSLPQRLSVIFGLKPETSYHISKTTVHMERAVRSASLSVPLTQPPINTGKGHHQPDTSGSPGKLVRSFSPRAAASSVKTIPQSVASEDSKNEGILHMREVHEKVEVSPSTVQGGVFNNARDFGIEGSAFIDAGATVSEGSSATVNNKTYINNKHTYYIVADKEAIDDFLEGDGDIRSAAEVHRGNPQMGIQYESHRKVMKKDKSNER